MKNILLLFIGFTFLAPRFLNGQDMQFTQFYASPVYLNPAFTGANSCSRVSLIYRKQWNGMSNPYTSYMVSFDHYLYNKHIGLGLIVAEDHAGAGSLKTTLIKPSIAYGFKITKKHSIRLGMQPGVGIRSVDYGKLLFGDQIYRGGNNVATVEAPMQSKTYFDLSAGILLNGKQFWTGVSIYHLNAPNESMINGSPSRIPMQLSLHSGFKIDLNTEEKDSHQKKYFTPVLHYRHQKKFDQLDIGFYLTKHIFTVGAWYRGIPLLKAYQKGYQNNDALAFIGGLQTERLKVGYSYDITISNLARVAKGAHEITLSLQICDPKKRKTKFELISCPKF
ncbi:hypothetical protein CNR22_23085 [Sphingobacteriaceae bacterium]|nr:hypothetical protein CNR22_23085 [Sphingobacteriaceae bacterium]